MKCPAVVVQPGGGKPERVEVPKLIAKLVNAAELVAQPVWEDGVEKGERHVYTFFSQRGCSLVVKVQNPPVKLQVAGKTYDEAWAALELVLKQPDIPWQDDSERPAGGKKKKK